MDAAKKSNNPLINVSVDVKYRLSALWAALMFTYVYADILGFYTPGTIEQLITGNLEGVQVTESFLTIMAVWMALPSLMIFLALVMRPNLNRWANIVVGVVSLLALGVTFFVGEVTLRYIVQALLEGILIVTIVWPAWRWPRQR